MTTDKVEKWLESHGFDYKSEASARAAVQEIQQRGLGSAALTGFLRGSKISGKDFLKKYKKEKSWIGYWNEQRFLNRVQKENDEYRANISKIIKNAKTYNDLFNLSIDNNYEVYSDLSKERQNLMDFFTIQENNIKEGKNLGELGQELDEITEFKGTKIPAGLKNVLRRQYGEVVSPTLQRRMVIPQYKTYEQRESYIKDVARTIAPQRITRGETDADYTTRINAEWKDIVPTATLRNWFTEYELKQ